MSRTPSPASLRLGTRGSALAMWQAEWTRTALERGEPGVMAAVVTIRTTGDRITDVPLAEVGGKGLFTKELDEALLDGRIDAAVHSLKDLPFDLPAGLLLAAVCEREDPRDALVSDGRTLDRMPTGARIGTSSMRRRAQILARFPDVEVMTLRGNVDTRLRKLDDGAYDGIILAAAGLKRLGHAGRITEILRPEVMLPAIGQGALAIVCLAADMETRQAVGMLDDPDTRAAVTAERAVMARLDGSCRIPIAAYAVTDDVTLRLEGLIASLDGARVVSARSEGPRADAGAVGRRLAERLRASGGEEILREIADGGS